MKTILSILFLFLLALTVLGQGGPIWRNSWTTNQAPPVRGTNLGVTNTASGFMWKFYDYPDSNMVARLGDVSNIVGSSSAAITNAVASVWTNGIAVVASGATNIEFFGVIASNTPVGQIGNVRVWIQPSSGTNVNFFFVTNGLYASNVFATNLTVDLFIVNQEMQLSNALRVPFGGTGTNTNALGSFYIGNGTNCAQWLNTNVFANWLSNQIGASPTGDFIQKSNGFGTNLSLLGYFSVSTTGLFVTNWAGTFPRVGIATNSPRATLHINSEYPFCALLVASNEWLGSKPSLIVTGGFVGIGRHDPRLALDVRGSVAVSGELSSTNGLYSLAGAKFNNGMTNFGIAVFDNRSYAGIRTTMALNTNGEYGISVLQIAAGTNGNVGPVANPTNQWVILYTNHLYGTGFAVETNGKVTANTFVGAGISAQGLTVTTNGTDYISTTNLYFIGQPKITNASGDVSIDITPGAASGAFVQNSNGFATNLTAYTLVTYQNATLSNTVSVYDPADGTPVLSVDVSDGVAIYETHDPTLYQKWLFDTNDFSFRPIRFIDTTNLNLGFMTNHENAVFYGRVGIGTNFPQAPFHVWGSNTTGPYVFQVGTINFTNAMTIANNGSTVIRGSLNSGSATVDGLSSSIYVQAAAANVIRWSGRGGMACSTNGTIKFFDDTAASGQNASATTDGATLLFNVVDALPFPAANFGVFTNRQFGLGNTNGTLTVSTSTNGTNRSDMFGVNESNVWVQTQQMSNNVANQLPGQPLACYGSMMFSTTNYGQVFGVTAYTNVTGYNVWNTNWFTVNTNTGYMTNVFAGFYRVTATISFVGENGKTYEGCLLTNDVDPHTISWYATFDTPARYRSQTAAGVIFLPANTGCAFAMKEIDGQSAIQIFRGSVTIGTP